MTGAIAPAFCRSPAPPRGFALERLMENGLERRLYLMPAGLLAGEAAAAAVIGGNGWPIADGALAFGAVAVLWRDDALPFGAQAWVAVLPFHDMIEWAEAGHPDLARFVGAWVRRLGRARPGWGGLDLSRPRLMGIVNTTPDSFSDGGESLDPAAAIAHGLAMVEQGADLIDVGGESTRPGAQPVGVEEELARVLPVVRALAEQGVTVSIDTRNAPVMTAAVAAGARIINDVAALSGPGALAAAAASGADVVLMHMQGDPRTMQQEPRYGCAPLDVYDALAARVAACMEAGIAPERLCVDPGIGFGKTPAHNAQVLAALPLYHGLGCPVLLGASRKSFVARFSRNESPRQRLPGSLAAHLAGWEAGVQIVRVHDVAETWQAARIWHRIKVSSIDE